MAGICFAALGASATANAQSTNAITIRDINAGQTISSTMDASDAVLASDNSPIEIYRVRVRAGQSVVATIRSNAFQPTLSVGDVQNADVCDSCSYPSESNDHDATARKSATADGFVYIRTNTMNAGDSGAYTLKVEVVNAPVVRPVRMNYGTLVQGTLSDADAKNDDGNYFDTYSVRLPANKRIQIDASSEAFDSVIKLIGPDAENIMSELAEDDDSGPGLNSRIRFTTTRAGIYRINMSSVGDTKTGAYTIIIGDEPARTPLRAPTALNLGDRLTGELSDSDPKEENEGEEVAVQRYVLNAVANTPYWISVDAPSFDPTVEVGRYGKDNEFEVLASDDDGGEGTNSLMRFKPLESGAYIVRVHSISNNPEGQDTGGDTIASGMGRFTIGLKEAPVAPAPSAATPINVGQTLSGTLTDGGPRRENDSLYAIYSVSLTSGQRVTITMNSSENSTSDLFDPFLEIGTGTPASFTKLAEDDDGGAELNSRLRFEAPSAGTYLIRATAVNSTNFGDFSLAVVNTPPTPPAPTPVAIQIGETKSGTLSDSDATYGNDDKPYDLYSFDANVGDVFIIELNSADFDSLVGAKAQSAADTTYVEDDDGGGELHSKLEYTVTVGGRQTIRVSSFSDSAAGSYSLKLRRK
jgi:hypothetical protein